ncbi:MAG: tRNA uridine-5-carboxymethylaminomethyl(34) synthesis GTPase MnmE [Gemmatimonadota bacterium]
MNRTVAAISTAPGRAGVALVRVSGPDVPEICSKLGLFGLQPRQSSYRHLHDPDTGEVVDHALVTLFAGPASYTGEDVLEISTHGGAIVPHLVLDAVVAAGAALAAPGEFTRRAYLNGKLDLIQAEATLDLVDARSPAMQRAAVHQLERGLSERVEEMRRQLLELQALLAYDIDFPEEDDGALDVAAIAAAAAELQGQMLELLSLAPEGELLHDGALVVLAGRPNVGKSSLFNSLHGRQRAIVTPVPGTTRDAIESVISLDGYPFRLVDTAGLRSTSDEVEELGVEVARSYLAEADIILFCTEAGAAPDPEDERFLAQVDEDRPPQRSSRVIKVRTKADMVTEGASEVGWRDGAIAVSALTGQGMAELRQRLSQAAFGGLRRAESPPLITKTRQSRALRRASGELEAFQEALKMGPAEIASTHAAEVTLALEELLGVVATDDILDVVFGSFCVGK